MESCIFCKIIKGELESSIVYENDKVIAFKDINPKADIHIVILTKEHIETLIDLPRDSNLGHEIFLGINEVAKIEGLDERGFKVLANVGKEGGQIIPHLHFHLLGGEIRGIPV